MTSFNTVLIIKVTMSIAAYEAQSKSPRTIIRTDKIEELGYDVETNL